MNKSKSAPMHAPATTSDGRPKKAVAKKIAPVAAKAGKGDTEPAHELASKSKTRAVSGAENKHDSRSAKAVVATTNDDHADNVEKTAVSKVSEVATKTSKSPSSVSSDGALLSEAQILKMGDKDYMNAAQLAFFKARLQQLEKDLLKNAGETTEHLRETVLVPDPADRATIEEEHALELRTRDRERKLLKKVQQSIASIDAGDYGWCEETGEPIGIPRLLARPTATLSLEAQQRRELKQKLYGD